MRGDEMGLSRCIASLLNPTGTHGQGNLFLKEFLKRIDNVLSENELVKNWSDTVTDGCEVSLEKQAKGLRRIDVYLRFNNGDIIGIENKPWARDQENQLADYADYIKNQVKPNKWLMIYLSKNDPSDSNYSIKKEDREEHESAGNFAWIDYKELVEWLEFCAQNSKALNVRIFIEELTKFVSHKINGDLDMSEIAEVKSIILKSTNNFETAFHIFKTIKNIKEDLLNKFHDELKIKLVKKGYELIWDESMSSEWKRECGFGIKFNKVQNLYLRFEFASSRLNDLYWGIKRENEQIQKCAELWNKINNVMNEFGSAGSTERWPWWNYVNKNQELGLDFLNWDSNEKPWMCIMSDLASESNLVEKIIKLATRVDDVFKKHSNTNLLAEGVVKHQVNELKSFGAT